MSTATSLSMISNITNENTGRANIKNRLKDNQETLNKIRTVLFTKPHDYTASKNYMQIGLLLILYFYIHF